MSGGKRREGREQLGGLPKGVKRRERGRSGTRRCGVCGGTLCSPDKAAAGGQGGGGVPGQRKQAGATFPSLLRAPMVVPLSPFWSTSARRLYMDSLPACTEAEHALRGWHKEASFPPPHFVGNQERKKSGVKRLRPRLVSGAKAREKLQQADLNEGRRQGAGVSGVVVRLWQLVVNDLSGANAKRSSTQSTVRKSPKTNDSDRAGVGVGDNVGARRPSEAFAVRCRAPHLLQDV